MSRRRIYVPLIAAMTAFFVVAMMGVAGADGFVSDGDTLSTSVNVAATCDAKTASSSATLTYSNAGGNRHYASDQDLTVTVTPDSPITVSGVPATLHLGTWTSGTASFTFSTNVAANTPTGAYKVTSRVSGKDTGNTTYTLSDFFVVNVTCDTTPTNVAPIPGTISGSDSVDEGSTGGIYTSDASDSDGPDPLTYQWSVSGNASINGSSTESSVTLDFGDGCATCTATLSLTVSDGADTASPTDLVIDVNNLPPTVTASFAAASVDCRANATLNVDFDDPYDGDGNWDINIDWGDSSTDTTDTQSADEPDPDLQYSHAYASPNNYTATVTVTDKDGATDNGAGSVTAGITINQTYAVDFLPPFDDSSPSGLIVNKMKNGRVVPVKATIYDECTLSFVTDPATVVTIKTSKTSGTGTGDPIEEYADAGSSSAGTNVFRWSTDGFWIYNLDSKALGLIVNSLYRVDVYVGAVKATTDTWAVLQPVK